MSRGRCQVCAGRSGAHYGWCSIVGGPGHRHTQPEPAGPSWSARLGHLEAPPSVLTVAINSAAVVAVTSAVLCPACLGDWCEACDWTGLSRPVEPVRVPIPVGVVHQLPRPAAPAVPVGGVAA